MPRHAVSHTCTHRPTHTVTLIVTLTHTYTLTFTTTHDRIQSHIQTHMQTHTLTHTHSHSLLQWRACSSLGLIQLPPVALGSFLPPTYSRFALGRDPSTSLLQASTNLRNCADPTSGILGSDRPPWSFLVTGSGVGCRQIWLWNPILLTQGPWAGPRISPGHFLICKMGTSLLQGC